MREILDVYFKLAACYPIYIRYIERYEKYENEMKAVFDRANMVYENMLIRKNL